MALISIPTDHIKLRKTISFEKKPLMLKDYLLRDDLSSCSSNGFKSFPRQHCCTTTVRFLLEAELKKSKDNYSTTTKRLLKRRCKKPGATTISALQRASEAVLNAVKLLPFPSIKSSSPSLKRNSSRQAHFTRSFSRKLFKRSLWRKADKEDGGGGDGGEIRRCKLFREFLEEKNQPSNQNSISTSNVNTTTDSSATTMIDRRVSSDTSSNSWAESAFTEDVLQSWSGNSESSSGNDIVEAQTVSNVVGVTVADAEDSINSTKEGKEQFSPVSVLDCPFHEEEEEDSSSHFEDGSSHVEGTKQKLMQKVPRFVNLAQLEPVDLEKRIAMTELEDWGNGDCEDVFVGWEMQEGRKLYLKEMERNENWRNLNEEKQDVGSALELLVFSSLVDELLTAFF
ncbi:hypothetical protein V6N12_001551 [Hibiscus sabdariffa]|uniref:DUF4378 domain-containing protein n=1 Tax=Hibiscus sabdariffa TaxID=183260 RepID=A0ABR2AT29_9ROSI